MDLNSYLKRIGWSGRLETNLDSLTEIHLRHATSIPFENIDIQLGRSISLELEALERKMVQNVRGGYCFEQNTLFQAVLREVGFDVIACEARVRMGRTVMSPRTHMILIVRMKEGEFLVDVGFGGDGLLMPVPMDGQESMQFLWRYRVVREEETVILQILRGESWIDLYAFLPQAREPVDFEVANWYTSTHPESRFVQTLTAQLPTPDARYILRNQILTIERGGKEESRELRSKRELLAVLSDRFGLSFPEETNFRNPTFR